MNLHIGITILEEEKIYEYNVGSYVLGDAVEDILQTSPPVVKTKHQHNMVPRGNVSNHRPYSAINNDRNDDAERFVDFYKLCSDLGISLSELFILAEHTTGNALHVCTDNELEYLRKIMVRLSEFDHEGRRKVWKEFLRSNKITAITGYKFSEISFPFLLNSKKLIKNRANKAKLPAGTRL